MRYILVLLGLLVSGTANAVECRETPDCSQMGYSTESDPNCKDDGYIFCPFDKTYKKCVNMNCEALGFTKDDKTSWCNKLIKCKGDTSYTLCQNLCEIGDVFYADGTCGYAQDYDPNDKTKIPVGVVYYVTDEGRHGKVVALKDLQAKHLHSYWSDKEGMTDIIIPIGVLDYDFNYYTNEDDLLLHLKAFESPLFDGKANTLKMLEGKQRRVGCSNGTYKEDSQAWDCFCQPTAALLAMEYVPDQVSADNPITGQKQWYIPSIGEMMQLYGTDFSQIGDKYWDKTGSNGEVLKIVNQTLTTLKKGAIPVVTYWTSSPALSSGEQFCTFQMAYGSQANDGPSHSFPVRPVLAF